jgi:hypothetical protein
LLLSHDRLSSSLFDASDTNEESARRSFIPPIVGADCRDAIKGDAIKGVSRKAHPVVIARRNDEAIR